MVGLVLCAQISIAKDSLYICSYDDIYNISNYSEGATVLTERQLTADEEAKMESAFDDAYNCDEGVDLIGSVKTKDGADYLATCWADSLGPADVTLPQSCEKDLN